MRKFLPGIIILFFSLCLSAKQVKFSVDMTGQTISALGVHVTGDFQEAAGYALNWDPASTTVTQEGATNIYSIIVNIPAFQKYEFRFVNGDQTYDAEFVPEESRVGYNFDDNRWVYIDSVANDITDIGATVFGANAPAGLNLVRFKVDMNNVSSVSANGVHVSDNVTSTKVRMYSFGSGLYETIRYYSSNSYSYKYYNGNISGDAETIPITCSVFGNRDLTIAKDTVMAEVCFNYCTSCASVSVKEIASTISSFKLFPNPAKSDLTIESSNELIESFTIYNVTGQEVKSISNVHSESLKLSGLSLSPGMYMVKITDSKQQQQITKLIIE